MNTLTNAVAKFTLEEIYEELYQIKRDLAFLEDEISLTKKQRSIYNDIDARVKKLLGQR